MFNVLQYGNILNKKKCKICHAFELLHRYIQTKIFYTLIYFQKTYFNKRSENRTKSKKKKNKYDLIYQT